MLVYVVSHWFVPYAMVETQGKTFEEMSRLFGVENKLAQRFGVQVEDLGPKPNDRVTINEEL